MSSFLKLCPPEGRWRPGLMACDQTTCVIYTQLSSQDIHDVFRVADFQKALADAPRGTSRSLVFSKISDAVKGHHAALYHELDHLRRQFSTSCGFLQLHLRSKFIWACQRLAMERQTRGDLCPFPLVSSVERGNSRSSIPSDRRGFYQYLTTADLQTQVVASVLAASAAIIGIESGASVSNRVLADAGLNFAAGEGNFAPIGFVTPHYEPEIDEWLGSLHLLEHMAVLQELCWLTHLGGGLDGWTQLVQCDSRYNLMSRLWHNWFPESLTLDQGRLRPTDMMTDVYRIWPVEFYALLDLALWVPFSPVGFRSARQCLRWEDVQPGHRFLQAMRLLKDSGRALTPVTSDNRESRFIETQQWMAGEMEWEPVENLVAEWLHYFQSDQWFNEGLFAGYLENPIVAIARTVLARRLAQPFDVVLNNITWGTEPACQFAAWMMKEGDGICRMRSVMGEEQSKNTRHSYYLFRGCERLLFGRPSYLLRLDDDSRNEAMDVLAKELSCPGWDEQYFRETASPSLGLWGSK